MFSKNHGNTENHYKLKTIIQILFFTRSRRNEGRSKTKVDVMRCVSAKISPEIDIFALLM